jgi:hypothetical protein
MAPAYSFAVGAIFYAADFAYEWTDRYRADMAALT